MWSLLSAAMAKIRVVDSWLRSPVTPPTNQRVVMVVAEKWAEQKVLMRAYASARDQTQPTVALNGVDWPIGPAGVDPNGPWGVHVQAGDPRGPEVASHLESAARRLFGAKGNAPRLVDEESRFDQEPTGNWDPDSPARQPVTRGRASDPPPIRLAPTANTVAGGDALGNRGLYAPSALPVSMAHHPGVAGQRPALPRPPRAPTAPGGRTALGYQSGAGAQSALVRLGLSPSISAKLPQLAQVVVPADFQISPVERMVLNMLGDAALYEGRRDVAAREVGQLIAVGDPVAWMEELMTKLDAFGLQVVAPGVPTDGEPSYRLRW